MGFKILGCSLASFLLSFNCENDKLVETKSKTFQKTKVECLGQVLFRFSDISLIF